MAKQQDGVDRPRVLAAPRALRARASQAPAASVELESSVGYSASDAAAFSDRGYHTWPAFLTPASAAALRDKVDAVWAQATDHGIDTEWIMNLHQSLPADDNWMWELATHPVVLAIMRAHLFGNTDGESRADALDGAGAGVGAGGAGGISAGDADVAAAAGGIVLYSTQLSVKPPRGGHATPFHQDGGADCRTLWICLDDCDARSGGLRVLPGRHKLGRLPLQLVDADDEEGYESTLFHARRHVYGVDLARSCGLHSRKAAERAAHAYELPAGSAAIHHPLTPHAAGRNCTAHRWRRAIIMRYQPARRRGEFDKMRGFVQHWRSGIPFLKRSYVVWGTAPADADVGVDPRGEELQYATSSETSAQVTRRRRSPSDDDEIVIDDHDDALIEYWSGWLDTRRGTPRTDSPTSSPRRRKRRRR